MKLPWYRISDLAKKSLMARVAEIERNPGTLPGLSAPPSYLSLRAVVDSLPNDLTEEDLVGILRLAMLTECGTDLYAAVFMEGAKAYDAPWLGRFTERTWVPDEHSHMYPFMGMLMTLGYSEEDLLRQIKKVRAEGYTHCCGTTPVELTTFGIMQEYLTDNWHGHIAKLHKGHAPEAAAHAFLIKRRERLHMRWYLELTVLQVEENPEAFLPAVAETILNIKLPGNSFEDVEPLQKAAGGPEGWLVKMEQDFDRMTRDLFSLFHEALGKNFTRSGRIGFELGSRSGAKVGPIAINRVKQILDNHGALGEWMYELFGESLMEAVHAKVPPRWFISRLIRSWIAKRVPIGILSQTEKSTA